MNKEQMYRLFFYLSAFSYLILLVYYVAVTKHFSNVILKLRLHKLTRQNITPSPTTVTTGIQKVILVVGVLSRLDAIERRMALRSTWFHTCNENKNQVACTIFTDAVDGYNPIDRLYLEEKEKYPGLVHMPFKGFNFGLRLLWMFEYFKSNYEFDFFLRVDDDYFVCLDRLLKELSHRPKQGLYWGWVHCQPNIVRVDEGFMILSHDIISEALMKANTTLMCSAYGDQSVPLWLEDSRLSITWFVDNERIVHRAEGYEKGQYQIPELCTTYLAIHRSYPKYVYRYWLGAEQYNRTTNYTIPQIPEFHRACPLSTKFSYNAFYGAFRSVPQLCKNIPRRNDIAAYGGRTN